MGLRFILLVLLSIALMVLDYREHYLTPVRNLLTGIVAPIQYAVNVPIQFINDTSSHLSSRQTLLSENTTLRANQLLMEAKLQKLIALENENTQLRALLTSSTRSDNEHITVAQLLAVSTDPLMSEVVLDKGQNDEVYVGQPVLDASGIMGQIAQVGPFTSRVLLLSDPRSAIPVQAVRNGIRGIVLGKGALGNLALTDIPITVDIRVGDILVSSGLGGHYPEGYPVGVVSRVRHDQGGQFAAIEVIPSAQLDRNQPVLLIWPTNKNLSIDAPAIQSEHKALIKPHHADERKE